MSSDSSKPTDTTDCESLVHVFSRRLIGLQNLDIPKIQKSLALAADLHKDHGRKSGEPYINHPIRVAEAILSVYPSTSAVIGALLHDTVEDTPLTADEVKREFGEEIQDIIISLTKFKTPITKLEGRTKKEVIRDDMNITFAKILKSGKKNPIAILIKLLDRLDNLRDIHVFDRKKQLRIANESYLYYAELAKVMGLGEIETKLRDICFKIKAPLKYNRLQKKITFLEDNARVPVNGMVDLIKDALCGEYLVGVDVIHRYPHEFMNDWDIRYELPASIAVKVKQPIDCYRAMGELHTRFQSVAKSIRDYISNPKSNGWRGLTSEMFIDKRKTLVSFLAEEHIKINRFGLLYAAGKYQPQQKKYFDKFIDFCLDIFREHTELQNVKRYGEKLPMELPTNDDDSLRLEDIFRYADAEEIQTFTPKGKTIKTSSKATILDFAFAVSSKLGHHCKAGEIKGILYPLDTQLIESDTITIIIDPNIRPQKSWLNFAATPKARKEIQKYLRTELPA